MTGHALTSSPSSPSSQLGSYSIMPALMRSSSLKGKKSVSRVKYRVPMAQTSRGSSKYGLLRCSSGGDQIGVPMISLGPSG